MTKHVYNRLPATRPTPHRVPEGYFDELEEKILKVIEDDECQGSCKVTVQQEWIAPRKRMSKRGILLRMAAAAVFIGVAVTSTLPIWQTEKENPVQLTPEQAFNAMSEADQEFILDSYGYIIDADDSF